MASVAIEQVPTLSKRLKARCRLAKLSTVDEVILTPPDQLAAALRISRQDVDLFLLQVASVAAPAPVTALDILQGRVREADGLLAPLAPCDMDDSDSDSADSDDSEVCLPTQAPSSSFFVPPTQGYDGNFPGVKRFVVDSDDESDYGELGRESGNESDGGYNPRKRPWDIHLEDSHTVSDDDQVPGATPRTSANHDPLLYGRPGHLATTGSLELDELLNGGFRSASLSEIVGESAAGKTQLAIQLGVFAILNLQPLLDASAVASPLSDRSLEELLTTSDLRCILSGRGMRPIVDGQGPDGRGVCFITSSGERAAFAIVQRAVEIAEHSIRQRLYLAHITPNEGLTDQQQVELAALEERALELGRRRILANLHIACVADIEALDHAVKYSLPATITKIAEQRQDEKPFDTDMVLPEPVGVIVVDNVPSLFQEDPVASDIDSLAQRSKMLAQVADALKQLNAGRAVIVINHVIDAFGADKDFARRFVLEGAQRIRISRPRDPAQRTAQGASGTAEQNGVRPSVSVPDHPAPLGYVAQSAFFNGLVASIPPTLAETISMSAHSRASVGGAGEANESPLYVLSPKTAQLGHNWINNVNVRLYLSKTRGRVPDPSVVSQQSNSDTASKARLLTVRKAAVVFNAFGPSMLDPVDPGLEQRANIRQLRYVITEAAAVRALSAYNTPSSDTSARLHLSKQQSVPSLQMNPSAVPSSFQADADVLSQELRDEDLLSLDLGMDSQGTL
ncbi:P-loop containing nucleoside triphosphate hydrolase protein [Testicularia cyperi]|uniref:P-loop containing nucleoside triphosphate hydrolase protein n=1 Tax=Testicularia cyperi TaxID=1882483 RepID=A0A317Y0W9_9BASI|nr:P-loop containing nucleoside triphosphate hydrolase protein [Testicularia cyperi]